MLPNRVLPTGVALVSPTLWVTWLHQENRPRRFSLTNHRTPSFGSSWNVPAKPSVLNESVHGKDAEGGEERCRSRSSHASGDPEGAVTGARIQYPSAVKKKQGDVATTCHGTQRAGRSRSCSVEATMSNRLALQHHPSSQVPGKNHPGNTPFGYCLVSLWSATLLRETGVTLRQAVSTLGRMSNVFEASFQAVLSVQKRQDDLVTPP